MNENQETNNIKASRLNIDQGHCLENRQKQERRTEPSKGYLYISAVGWIDRREILRRKDDCQNF